MSTAGTLLIIEIMVNSKIIIACKSEELFSQPDEIQKSMLNGE